MSKRVAIVTGANAGIGFEVARGLLERDSVVGLVCRDIERGHDACARLLRKVPHAQIHLVRGDLASLHSVREAADEIRERFGRVHLLVNNAGAVFSRRSLSPEGVEMHLATNFLGHFLLTVRLLEQLTAVEDEPGCVVQSSSVLHRIGRWPRGRTDFPRTFHLVPAYARSKLAIVAASRALARRTPDSMLLVRCVDPGLTRTDIQRGAGPIQRGVGRWLDPMAHSAEVAARFVLRAAEHPGTPADRTSYFARARPTMPSRRARHVATEDAVWHWACGFLSADERARLDATLVASTSPQ